MCAVGAVLAQAMTWKEEMKERSVLVIALFERRHRYDFDYRGDRNGGERSRQALVCSRERGARGHARPAESGGAAAPARAFRPRPLRRYRVDAPGVRWRGASIPADQLDRAHGAPTDRLHARGTAERRAAPREAVPVARRYARAGTVPALSRGGRSGRPHVHLSAPESLHARPPELPVEHPGAERLLRRRR